MTNVNKKFMESIELLSYSQGVVDGALDSELASNLYETLDIVKSNVRSIYAMYVELLAEGE